MLKVRKDCALAGALVFVSTWLAFPQHASAACLGLCNNSPNDGDYCVSVADCPGGTCDFPARCVRLALEPAVQAVAPGGIATVDLIAYPDDGNPIDVSSASTILNWDETRLRFTGFRDACQVCDGGTNDGLLCESSADCPGGACANAGCGDSAVCSPDRGPLFQSTFFPDCNLSQPRLNEPCENLTVANDGDAYYQASYQTFNCQFEELPPWSVTSSGFHIASFLFEVLGTDGGAIITIPDEQTTAFGTGQTFTTVVFPQGGTAPPNLATPLPSAQILFQNPCDPATVEGMGPRYLGVTPPPGDTPVAILVEGDPTDPNIACVSGYVQAECLGGTNVGGVCETDAECPGSSCWGSGLLAQTPIYRLPADWGTVAVRGIEITPESTYDIRMDCGPTPGTNMSDPVSGTTWIHGNTDNSTQAPIVNFFDITTTVWAFQRRPTVTVEQADVLGDPFQAACLPQRTVDFIDITGVVWAFQGKTYVQSDCAYPCP